jgi:hypothetical protein
VQGPVSSNPSTVKKKKKCSIKTLIDVVFSRAVGALFSSCDEGLC